MLLDVDLRTNIQYIMTHKIINDILILANLYLKGKSFLRTRGTLSILKIRPVYYKRKKNELSQILEGSNLILFKKITKAATIDG